MSPRWKSERKQTFSSICLAELVWALLNQVPHAYAGRLKNLLARTVLLNIRGTAYQIPRNNHDSSKLPETAVPIRPKSYVHQPYSGW